MSNSTQNDWDGELYKVACHIHAESMAYKVGMAGADDPEMSIYKRLKTLLADARKEGHELGRLESVEFEVDKARKEALRDVLVEMDRTASGYASGDYVNGWSDCRTIVAEKHRVLATLKEEQNG